MLLNTYVPIYSLNTYLCIQCTYVRRVIIIIEVFVREITSGLESITTLLSNDLSCSESPSYIRKKNLVNLESQLNKYLN